MPNATSITPHRGPGQPTPCLLLAAGGVIDLPASVAIGPEFTYAGRLWTNHAQMSEHFKRPVYVEVTPALINEIRDGARQAWNIAERMAKSLNEMNVLNHAATTPPQ